MLPSRLLAAALATLGGLRSCAGFAVVGYVPDYRWDHLDWDLAVTRTTHLVLFSLEPKADSGLEGVDRLKALLKPGTPLRNALSKAEKPAKLLVTLGGTGRSQHFPKIAGNKKARKKVAQAITSLFEELPVLSGLDLDWEAPTSSAQWRDLGKFAQELRSTWLDSSKLEEREGSPLLTMTYHPGTGAVAAFANLKAKKSEKAFIDLFDFCHAMAYAHFDNERRHSSENMDKASVDEWRKFHLPLNRMTLGMPFFGVSRKTGEILGVSDILSREPALEKQPEVDESQEGIYFINAGSMVRKVEYAGRQGLGGVMIWELGQEKQGAGGNVLLRHIWQAADGIRESWRYKLSWLPFSENHVIMALSALAGAYLLREVIIGTPPGHKVAAQRPPPPEARRAPPPADGNAAAAAPAASALAPPAEELAPVASENERG